MKPLFAPNIVLNLTDIVVPSSLLVCCLLTCFVPQPLELLKSPLQLQNLQSLLLYYVLGLCYLQPLGICRLLQKMKVVQQQANIDLGHFVCFMKPITSRDGYFLLSCEQLDLLNNSFAIHFTSFDLFPQSVINLLFFTEFFLHLC